LRGGWEGPKLGEGRLHTFDRVRPQEVTPGNDTGHSALT
jgi:hypothetical protein